MGIERSTKHSSRDGSTETLAERRFHALLDNVLDIVAVVDTTGVISIANLAVRTLLGRAHEEVIGASFWELLHEDDVGLGREVVGEALTADGIASPVTVRAWHADGTLVTLEISAQSLLDDPAVAGILVYARDVTERIWVGTALQESERRFTEIFENMLEGVVQIEERSRTLIRANPAFCEISGCTQEEVFGFALDEIFTAEDRPEMERVLGEHFEGKRRVTESLRIKRRDGTVRYIDLGTSRIALSGVSTTIAVVRDVTVRRDTERSREMFLAVVAHELRTPVAILRNSVELLRSRVDTMSADDRSTLLDVLSEETARLTHLVGDALDMGAIQAGSLALRPRRVALAPIVEAVATRIGAQFQASATLRLEKVVAHVDPLRFEQVLTNLLENAWRHGGSSVNVIVTIASDPSVARVAVEDDGPGFPHELRDKLFDRVLLPNSASTSGLGIGLWLCRRLVDSMGGTISAMHSSRGASVAFTVPLEQPGG